MTDADRNAIVVEHLPLVQAVAKSLLRGIDRSWHVEDLEQVGAIGLMQAVDKWNPETGKTVWQYAASRVRGAILDHLRLAGESRVHRRYGKTVGYFAIHPQQIEYFDLAKTDPELGRTEASIDAREIVSRLSPRDRGFVTLHYLAGLNLAEIGRREGKGRTAIVVRKKKVMERVRRQCRTAGSSL